MTQFTTRRKKTVVEIVDKKNGTINLETILGINFWNDKILANKVLQVLIISEFAIVIAHFLRILFTPTMQKPPSDISIIGLHLRPRTPFVCKMYLFHSELVIFYFSQDVIIRKNYVVPLSKSERIITHLLCPETPSSETKREEIL